MSMCSELKLFLDGANLSHLYDYLSEQGMELKLLLLANDSELRELVSNRMVDKIKLRSAIELYRKAETENIDPTSTASSISFEITGDRFLQSPSLLADINSNPPSPASSANVELIDVQNQKSVPPEAIATCPPGSKIIDLELLEPGPSGSCTQNTLTNWVDEEWQFIQEIGPLEERKPLRQLLELTTFGKSLLQKEENFLTPRERKALVQLIVEHQLRILPSIKDTIRQEVWSSWAKEICSQFKAEHPDIYYVPYRVTERQALPASGLLHNQLITHHRLLNLEGNSKRRSSSGTSSPSSGKSGVKRVRPLPFDSDNCPEDEDFDNIIEWLEGSSSPFDIVLKKWQASYKAREKNMKEKPIEDYFQQFPGLCLPGRSPIDNLSCFTHGCSTGWVSGVLGNEALTGGAWLAALPCLVALPAAPFFAVLADAKGRKAGAFCISVSFIISWSLAAWCGPRGVWAARIAAGAGGAGALALAPVYCAEIAPRTKGLAAMPALACSCGILFAYGAGGMLSAHALSLSMAVPPAVLLVSLLWLQETPSFLISIGRIQDAAKVICWFDGSDFQEDLTDVIEQQEVRIRTSECYGRRDAMRRQDSDTFQPMLKRSSGLDSNSDRRSEPSACRELFRHRRSRRALFSCFVLLCAAAGSGAGAVNSFAAAVLRHSTHDVPHLNLTVYNFTLYNGTVPRTLFDTSEAGSVMCGTALVLGAAVATVTVDKIGRKILLLWSCSGITCCLALLGIYCDPRLYMQSWYAHRIWPYRKLINDDVHQKIINIPQNIIDLPQNTTLYEDLMMKNYTKNWMNVNENLTEVPPKILNLTLNEDATLWAPVTLLSLVMFLYNIGLGSVPFVLVSDLFSINVRSLASSLLISWMWLSSFLLLRYYGTIAVSLGLHGTYYISASITLLGSLYTFFIIPETKGRSPEEIDEALDGPLLVKKKKNQR